MDVQFIENFTASINLIQNKEKFILIYSSKNYFIQEFLFELFTSVKKGNYNAAIDEIKYEHQLTEEEINSIKDQVCEVINNITTSKEKKKYINYSVILINENLVNYLSNKLKWLFKKKILILLASISILSSLYFFTKPYHKFNHSEFSNISISETFTIYITIFIILIFHELGHAAATSYFKIKPKEIGFGFYLIFPVLFANVTEIWKLTRDKRIIVNFAGIYFQLLFNILLIGVLIFFPDKSFFIMKIFKVNTFIALYSLIPFIRNDGYWIYSDYFDLQNLNQKSNSIPYQLLKKALNNESMSNLNFPLIIYSIGNYIFLGYIIWKFFILIPLAINELIDKLNNNSLKIVLLDHFGIILKILMCLFFTYLIAKTATTWFKETFKKSKNEKYI